MTLAYEACPPKIASVRWFSRLYTRRYSGAVGALEALFGGIGCRVVGKWQSVSAGCCRGGHDFVLLLVVRHYIFVWCCHVRQVPRRARR